MRTGSAKVKEPMQELLPFEEQEFEPMRLQSEEQYPQLESIITERVYEK